MLLQVMMYMDFAGFEFFQEITPAAGSLGLDMDCPTEFFLKDDTNLRYHS